VKTRAGLAQAQVTKTRNSKQKSATNEHGYLLALAQVDTDFVLAPEGPEEPFTAGLVEINKIAEGRI